MATEIVRLTGETELEAIHTEIFINTTPKVTKVSDHSVTRALIRGNVKTGKKALKDIALAISHLFPDSSFDTALDQVAADSGIAPRLAAAQSSTFVRFIASPGTIYQQGINIVSDSKGNVFDLEDDLTIGSKGFGYVKVRSQQASVTSNSDPYTIINVAPEPVGHIGLLNEYSATGGRDQESDDVFRQRIKEGPDSLSRGTLSYLTQAFVNINPNILRVIYEGIDSSGKVLLSLLTVNGIDLTDQELNVLLQQGAQYFSLTELNPIGTSSYGVKLQNVTYYPIDVSMRIELFDVSQLSTIVKDIQQKFSKYVDFRFWDSSLSRVEWDKLLFLVSGTSGVKYVLDSFFLPNTDITIPVNQFPRFRGFQAYDLNGSILIDQSGVINPIFYPSGSDVNFVNSVL